MAGIDSSIYFQQKTPDFLGAIERGMNMRQMADERALRQQQMQEDKSLQNILKSSVVKSPDGSIGFDSNTTFAKMAEINPSKAIAFQQQYDDNVLKTQKAKLDQQMQQVDLGSRLLSGVKDQESFDKALQTAQKFGIDNTALGKYYDPDLIKQYQSMSMTAKDNLSFQQQQLENSFKEKELGFKEKDLKARTLENKNKALKESTGMASELRKERSGLPTTRNTQEVSSSYNKMQLAAKYDNDPTADMNLIFSYMKMLDPSSSVKEGEYASAKNTTGIPAMVLDTYNKVRTGNILNPIQRKQFLNQAKDIYSSQMDVQKQVDSQFRDIAKKSGIAPEDVVLRFDANQPKPESIMQNGHEYFLNPKTGKYE